MSGFTFRSPAPPSGFSKDEHLDHTLVFVNPRLEEISTSYGDTTAAQCDYVVCLDDQSVDEDVKLFGTAIVPALTDEKQELVVAHLVRGTAKPGRQAPWLFEDPTEAELELAEIFFDKYATRTKAGRIVIDQPEPEPGKGEDDDSSF
jgi:hypothetical protein